MWEVKIKLADVEPDTIVVPDKSRALEIRNFLMRKRAPKLNLPILGDGGSEPGVNIREDELGHLLSVVPEHVRSVRCRDMENGVPRGELVADAEGEEE